MSVDITQLPAEIMDFIFSYLDKKDAGRASQVCYDWFCLLEGEAKWKNHLKKDVGILNISFLEDAEQSLLNDYHFKKLTDLKAVVYDKQHYDSKTLYEMCSPDVNARKRRKELLKEPPASAFSIISETFSRMFSWKKETQPIIPQFLLFGPGIESRPTSLIVRKIITSRNDTFLIDNLCPSEKNGIGSAVVLKYKRKSIKLGIIYSSSQKIREEADKQQRFSESKLFHLNDENLVELSETGKISFKPTEGLIYCIDARQGCCGTGNYEDLQVVLKHYHRMHQDNNWSIPPLLIWGILQNKELPHDTLQTVIESLDILKWIKFGFSWMVCFTDLEALSNINLGMDWLLNSYSINCIETET